MKLKQLSVFVENKAGRLLRIVRTLADAGVDLRALCVADTQDFGILRCVVGDPAAAAAALREEGVMYSMTEVIGVEVADEPRGLEEILRILVDGGIEVEYIYSFAAIGKHSAVIIFHVDRTEEAVDLLQAGGQRLLSHLDLAPGSA